MIYIWHVSGHQLLTVENGIRDGQEIGLEGIEAQRFEGQSEVLAGWSHGNLEGETENIQRPEVRKSVNGVLVQSLAVTHQRSKSLRLCHNNLGVIGSRLCIELLDGSSRMTLFTTIFSSL
jgi:hypothetical protein